MAAASPCIDSLKGTFFPNLPTIVPAADQTQCVRVEKFLSTHPNSSASLSEVYHITVGEISCVAKVFGVRTRHGNRRYTDERALLNKLNSIACLIPVIGKWIRNTEVRGLFYVEKGVSLRTLTDKGAHTFTLEEIQQIGVQLIQGLIALQKEGYFHRNLTLEHILVDKGRVYITSSRHLSSLPYFFVGHSMDFPDPDYAPPEVYIHDILNEKSSLFAVASVIYYLYTKSFPIQIIKKPYPEKLSEDVYWVWDKAAELLAQVNALGPMHSYVLDEIYLNRQLTRYGCDPIRFPKKADPTWSQAPLPASLRVFCAEVFLYAQERCSLTQALATLSQLNIKEEPSVPSLLELSIQGKEMAQEIGKGAFGKVYRLPTASGSRPHVIKTVSIENDFIYEVGNEIRMHAYLHLHPQSTRICRLLGYEFEKTKVHLLFEEQEKTLYDLLQQRALLPLEIKKLFSQISETVDFLAQKGLCHTDLSPSNVMVTAGEAFLIDFGKAWIGEKGELMRKRIHYGTRTIRTPEEYFINERLTTKADVWALGILLFTMVVQSQHPLFADQANIDQVVDLTLMNYIIQQIGHPPSNKVFFEYHNVPIRQVAPWKERLSQEIQRRSALGEISPGEFDKAVEILDGALRYVETRATAAQVYALALQFLGGGQSATAVEEGGGRCRCRWALTSYTQMT